jgi:hypothetical protein
MFKKTHLIFQVLFGLLFICKANGQYIIYTDKQDSFQVAASLLTGELNKAGFRNDDIRDSRTFSGNGFLIITRAKADSLRIAYPSVIKTFGPEGVYIKGDDKSIQIIGNTALALQQAIYIYLQQLGYRYLLPGQIWNVVPDIKSVYKKVNIITQPDFEHRSIANAHGFASNKKMEREFEIWAAANLLGGALQVKIGHAYDEIVSGNIETFKQHPEYFAETVAKGTIPEIFKFNTANRDLVNLVVQDAEKRMEQFKKWGWSTKMISMEPSDGGGFCTSAACKKIGGPSEQVFYLTNEVARMLQKKYPGTLAGGLAYNEHILPPSMKLEPNIFLMITNGFNRSKYNTYELLKMWKAKKISVGVYEYMSVYEWDNDMPGQIPAAKTELLKKTIQGYYNSGARSYMAESVMGWISKGPGEYVASRLLWNRNVNIDSVKKDFFIQAFGNTAPVLQKLYDKWENYPHKIPVESDMADWYGWVDEAYSKANSKAIKERIDQVKIYLHYVYLYVKLKKAPSEESMLNVMKFAYRNFETAAFATLPTMVSLPTYSGFKEMGWYANPNQKWKENNKAYTNTEIQSTFNEDKRSLKKGAELTEFRQGDKFIKLTEVSKLRPTKYDKSPHSLWGKTDFIIRISKKGKENYIEVSSGHTAQPDVSRNVMVDIYTYKNGKTDYTAEKPALHFEQSTKSVKEKFSLETLNPGIYIMKVDDQRKLFIMDFSPAIDYSIVMKPDEKILTSSVAGLNVFYFYVPPGVKNFRVHKTVILKLQSPLGRTLNYDNNREEVFDQEVRPGEDGIWMAYFQSGNLYIEGVPPYLGQLPGRMLVPDYLKK